MSHPFKNDFPINLRFSTPESAAEFILEGGILIYPTETFYAIGCHACKPASIEAIFRIKKRPFSKFMPIIGSDLMNLSKLIDIKSLPLKLIDNFWPGPLTLVTPANKNSPKFISNKNGKIAARISSDYNARKLAALCEYPIISTSANLSGEVPISALQEISSAFLSNIFLAPIPVGIACWQKEERQTRLPSTIIEPVGENLALVHREGGISCKEIEKYGFTIKHAS